MFVPAKDRHTLDKAALYLLGISMGLCSGSALPKGLWLNVAMVGFFGAFIIVSIAALVAHRRARTEMM
jgi:hypothetical protein